MMKMFIKKNLKISVNVNNLNKNKNDYLSPKFILFFQFIIQYLLFF